MSSVDEPVRLEAYDPDWPLQFEREAIRAREVLQGAAVGIEHIGSTAVPGLAAKPIVDVMVGVGDVDHSQDVVDRLTSLGHEDSGGAVGRRYLRRRDGPHFNIQIVEFGGPMWEANLLLRDYLRLHPDAARRYSEAKRIAAGEAPMLLGYSKLKSEMIEDLLRLARERFPPPPLGRQDDA